MENENTPAPEPTTPPQTPATPPPPPAPAAEPPPSSVVVVNGELDERIADLQAELQILRTERDNATGRNRKLETDIAHLQDQIAQLKTIPAPAPVAKSRNTFFDEN